MATSTSRNHREPVWADAPAVPLFAATAAGVAWAVYTRPSPKTQLAVLLVLLVLGIGRLSLARARLPLHLVILACLGAVSVSTHTALQIYWERTLPEGSGEWTGFLLLDTAPDGTVQYTLRLTEPRLWGGPKLRLIESEFGPPIPPEVWEQVQDGSLIHVRGLLRHPSPSGNPGEMNYAVYLYRRGIAGTVYLDGIEPVMEYKAPLVTRIGVRARAALRTLRLWVAARIQTYAPSTAAAVLLGMTIGERGALTDETERLFQRSGISHLLSVSGVHVGIVASLAVIVARLVRLTGVSRFVWINLAVWVFVLLSGARPSALRAGSTATLGLLGYQFRRRVEPLHFWAISGTVLLLVKPLLLFDIGFQLSYAATGSILLWLRVLQAPFRRKGPIVNAAVACGISLAAQWGTAVPIAFYFHELSLAGIVVNWIAVPLAGPVLMLTVGGLLLSALSGLGGAFITLAGWFVERSLPALQRVADSPWAAVEVPAPSVVLIVSWALLSVGAPLALTKGEAAKNRLGRCACVLGVALLVVFAWIPVFQAHARITQVIFIDVGQGDAILIRTPGGKAVLIDGGGTPRRGEEASNYVGERRLVPFLKHIGVRTLDLVVNTHPDEDHLQGLVSVLRHRNVRMVADSGQTAWTHTFAEYRKAVEAREIPYIAPKRGDVIELEKDILLRVLGPPRELPPHAGLNDASVVLRLETPHGSVLLTGDLERRGQQELLWEAENVDVAADVIKVPHHGAARDVDLRFIDAVAPAVAVILVGRNNFGHPAPETIQAYQTRGARVFRTDVNGAVKVWLTPWGIHVVTHRREFENKFFRG